MINFEEYFENQINKMIAEKFIQARKENPDLPMLPTKMAVGYPEGQTTIIDNSGVIAEIEKLLLKDK